jgi:peptidoglycan-N-acetylglucosamine deacetylase
MRPEPLQVYAAELTSAKGGGDHDQDASWRKRMRGERIGMAIGAEMVAVAAIGLGGAGAYAYASRWPGSQLFGQVLIAPRKPGEIALTFDDGPNPRCTPALLEILARHKVRATFFMIGQHAAREPELVREVAAAGHVIGNHTWTHPKMSRVSVRQNRDELERTSGELERILGSPVKFFRPPCGARRPATLRIARELGLTSTTWNVIGNDWNAPTVEAITTRVKQLTAKCEKRGYAINLCLHDGSDDEPRADRTRTVAATEELLAHYFLPNSKFVTLDAWA